MGYLVAVVGPQWHLTYGQSAIMLLGGGVGAIFGALIVEFTPTRNRTSVTNLLVGFSTVGSVLAAGKPLSLEGHDGTAPEPAIRQTVARV